ncbi:MAG: Zn-dependent hydrolase, partial [Gammaproteobacteria bacterium]
MPLHPLTLAVALALSAALVACQPQTTNETTAPATTQAPADESSDIATKVAAYEEVELTADLSHLAEGDRQAIGHLLEASEIMDALFWKQAYGDREALLAGIQDPATRRYVEINYGPWDRLDGNAPFVPGVGPRPPGANFYPADMTKAEFEAADLPGKDGLYTLVRRNEAGELVVVPYHEEYAAELGRAAELLRQA